MPLKNSRSHETPLPIEEGVSSEEPALEQEGSFEVDAGREAGRQEQDRQGRQGEKEGTSGAIQAVPTTVPSDESAVQTKDPLTQQVEAILEEDLKEVYDKMSPAAVMRVPIVMVSKVPTLFVSYIVLSFG